MALVDVHRPGLVREHQVVPRRQAHPPLQRVASLSNKY